MQEKMEIRSGANKEQESLDVDLYVIMKRDSNRYREIVVVDFTIMIPGVNQDCRGHVHCRDSVKC